jgi:hypothetical protein
VPLRNYVFLPSWTVAGSTGGVLGLDLLSGKANAELSGKANAEVSTVWKLV